MNGDWGLQLATELKSSSAKVKCNGQEILQLIDLIIIGLEEDLNYFKRLSEKHITGKMEVFATQYV